MCFIEGFELGQYNGVWAINGFYAPCNGFYFNFQRMNDNVKDILVLIVDWS